MKMVLITYNEALDEEVQGILDQNAVEGFTKWTKAYGKGRSSGPHLLSHVWPKGNHVLAIGADDETAAGLFEAVRRLRQTAGKEGLKAFLLPVEQVT